MIEIEWINLIRMTLLYKEIEGEIEIEKPWMSEWIARTQIRKYFICPAYVQYRLVTLLTHVGGVQIIYSEN